MPRCWAAASNAGPKATDHFRWRHPQGPDRTTDTATFSSRASLAIGHSHPHPFDHVGIWLALSAEQATMQLKLSD
jgi:hypothetical protein